MNYLVFRRNEMIDGKLFNAENCVTSNSESFEPREIKNLLKSRLTRYGVRVRVNTVTQYSPRGHIEHAVLIFTSISLVVHILPT